jgi:hypothetical protein
MTKDGRPSALNDIRLFAGDRYSYLKGQEEAVAYGRRLAWYLNGEGISVGAFPALYVLFTPSLALGTVRMTDDGGEWWHRYVHVGVEPNFPSVPNALEIAMRGIAKALVAIKPEHVETIKRADETVREHGEHLRFLLRRHETKKFVWQVSSNVAVWPKPSYLYVTKIDVETNAYAEAEPIALQFYSEALSYSRKIKFKDLTDFTERPRPPATSTKILQR